jgi:hypothetical protein
VTELCDGLTTRPLTTDDAQAVFEVIAAFTLGRTLKKRAVDVLTYFDRPGTSDGPTEAINGRLEHLRGSALQLPQPHQLHRQIPAGNRRLQTLPTPSIVKSRIT